MHKAVLLPVFFKPSDNQSLLKKTFFYCKKSDKKALCAVATFKIKGVTLQYD